MKNFSFTVDDSIRFLKEISGNDYRSIFDHPYLDMYRRLHDEFGLKIQLNLFYRMGDFELSQVSERYYNEWKENSDWLKLSFHSDMENIKPYEKSSYDEVYKDCKRTCREIVRFASSDALAKTTTIHYCLLTDCGLRAMENNFVLGLLGLFGTEINPRTSYGIGENEATRIRNGETIKISNISFASIDIVLNCFSRDEIIKELERLDGRATIRVMIHEQYFYEDYMEYQPDFYEKLRATFSFFREKGYQSRFFESLI